MEIATQCGWSEPEEIILFKGEQTLWIEDMLQRGWIEKTT